MTATTRMSYVSPLWHHSVLDPEHSSEPIVLDRAEGVHVWDVDGARYVDGLSSQGSAILGHGRADIAEAARAQMTRGAQLAPVFGCTNQPARLLAERLLDLTGHPGGAVRFATSGSEAVEAAIRIALSFHLNRDEPERRLVLVADGGYHGTTVAAAAATGRAPYRHFFRELDDLVVRLPPTPHADETASAAFLETLDAAIRRVGAGRVAAFLGEPVPASGGFRVPHPEHWRRVQDLLHRNGILHVTDEVLTGFGRTGALLAQQHYGIRGDLVTVSKGLSAGYFPISACVAAPHVAAEFTDSGERALQHMGTYSAHATGCAVALRVLDVLREEDLVRHAATVGERVGADLGAIAARRPDAVLPPTGRGLAWSLVLAPRAGRVLGREVLAAARRRGLLLMAHGDVVFLQPPLVSTPEQLAEMTTVIADAVDDVLAASH